MYPAVCSLITSEKEAPMIEKAYSHKEALAYGCWLLRQRTYQALLSAGETWQEALRKAQRWSSLGRAGVLFSVGTELERCFDTEGNLISPLEFAWQGNPEVIGGLMSDVQFTLTIPDLQPDTTWLRLTASAKAGTGSTAIIQGKQTALDTVVKINNARRREELVCCLLEDQRTHIVLLARRYHNDFQIKIALDEQWHPTSPRNVWKVVPKQQKQPSRSA
jgi:hypothetical protein